MWSKRRSHKQCTIEAAGLFIIGLLIVVYLQINQQKLNTPSKLHLSKGQMKSEWIYAVINFPNWQLKYCNGIELYKKKSTNKVSLTSMKIYFDISHVLVNSRFRMHQMVPLKTANWLLFCCCKKFLTWKFWSCHVYLKLLMLLLNQTSNKLSGEKS